MDKFRITYATTTADNQTTTVEAKDSWEARAEFVRETSAFIHKIEFWHPTKTKWVEVGSGHHNRLR